MNAAAVVAIALVCLGAACRKPTVSHAIDPEAAACIPAGTKVLAGMDLDRLRATPIYSKLPAAVLALAEQFASASSALAAYDGKDVLAIAHGRFPQPPAGATLATPNLALFGSSQLVNAALAQHRTGSTGSPALLERAEAVASGKQIWLVMQGGVALPLTGNAANLNSLLRNAEWATMTLSVGSDLAFAATVQQRSVDSAASLEETVRADITLGAAAVSRQPDLVKLLRSVQIDRNDRAVRITVSADADAAAKLLGK